MVLTGTYQRTLDDKLRFALPRGLRQQLSGSDPLVLFLAPGMDGSLVLYPEAAFEQLAQRVAQQSPTGKAMRAFSRLFYGQAQRCELDGQGRFRIPLELAQLAGMVREPLDSKTAREIVLVGVRDCIEVWDSQRWTEFCQRHMESYDQIAEAALLAGDARVGDVGDVGVPESREFSARTDAFQGVLNSLPVSDSSDRDGDAAESKRRRPR